jgi:hypothetical protein
VGQPQEDRTAAASIPTPDMPRHNDDNTSHPLQRSHAHCFVTTERYGSQTLPGWFIGAPVPTLLPADRRAFTPHVHHDYLSHQPTPPHRRASKTAVQCSAEGTCMLLMLRRLLPEPTLDASMRTIHPPGCRCRCADQMTSIP